MIYLKNITLIDENNIQEASFRSKQGKVTIHDDVMIYLKVYQKFFIPQLKKTNINFYTTNVYL